MAHRSERSTVVHLVRVGEQTDLFARLADRCVEALLDRKACLLANHGQVAIGSSLEGAFNMAIEIEQLARQLVVARQAGVPALLSREEMDEALARFADYGQPGS